LISYFSTQVERKYVDLLSKYDYDIGVAYTLKEKLLQDNEIIKVKTKNMEVRNIFNL